MEPQIKKAEMNGIDAFAIAADMAAFFICTLISGEPPHSPSNIQAANNLVGRELAAFAAWKARKVIVNDNMLQIYFQDMHKRVYQEARMLGVVNGISRKKEDQPWTWRQKLKQWAQRFWPSKRPFKS